MTQLDAGIKRLAPRPDSAVTPNRSISTLGSIAGVSQNPPPEFAGAWKHCGYQKILFTFEANENKLVHSLNAIIDIYFIKDPDSGAGALKVGRISYSGKLVPRPFQTSDPAWHISLAHSCNFRHGDSASLPSRLREFGPGAFITMVTQTLFGTTY